MKDWERKVDYMWSVEKMLIKAEKWYAPILEARAEEGKDEAKFIMAQTNKRLKNAKSCLDVPCGTGRVSIPLAKSGLNVIGVDVSKYYISLAKQKARKMKLTHKAKFIFGNMRDVNRLFDPEKRFDIVTNVFTSLGYGTKAEDIKFFKQLRSITKDDGLFFISHLANKSAQKRSKPFKTMQNAGDIVIIDEGHLDTKTSRSIATWRYFRDNGSTLKLLYSQKIDLYLYSAPEITKMLNSAGWKVVGIYNKEKKKVPLANSDSNFNIIAKAV
jgi:2-polyprenyl-3-methyl-5-hydroxy-6-metoxy-1,4-benzoquinol methylase